MKFFVAILVLAIAVLVFHQTNGLCNTCSITTQLACVAKDKFRVCLDEQPWGEAVECPPGTFCTSDAIVCSANPTTESCAKCNTCVGNFACTGYSEFAFCVGGEVKGANYSCPENLVCDSGSTSICVNPIFNGAGATCPWDEEDEGTTTTTTTPATTPDALLKPNEFCSIQGKGRHEVPTDDTCRIFISCSDTLVGNLYSCPPRYYFNETAGVCGDVKPERCDVP